MPKFLNRKVQKDPITVISEDTPEISSPLIDRIDAQISVCHERMQAAADETDFESAQKFKAKLNDLEKQRQNAVEQARYKQAQEERKARQRRQKAQRGGLFGKRAHVEEDGVEALPAVDFVRDPDGPQALVPFEMLFKDGIMALGNNRYSLRVHYDDTNYLLARLEDKVMMNQAYQQWLNSLDEDCEIQFTLISRHVDDKNYQRNYELEDAWNDEVGNTYRHELNAYIRTHIASSSTSSLQRFSCVTFTVEAKSHDDAARKLATLTKGFDRFCRRFGVQFRTLSGLETMDLVCSITKPDDEPGKYTYDDLSLGMTMRDLACPWRVYRPSATNNDSRLYAGNRWVKSYTFLPGAQGFGSTQRDTFLSDLMATGHDMIISYHIKPWSTVAATAAANKQYLDVSNENTQYRITRSRPERGYFIDETNMPRRMVEAEEGVKQVREELVQHRQRIFSVNFVAMLMSEDEQGIEDASRDIEAVFQSHQKPGYESWSSIREQSYATALPLGINQIPYSYNLMTNPLSCLMPFVSAEFMDKNGLLLGVNADTNSLLVYNRALREHTNALILGQPRAGKSVYAKSWQLQIKLRDPNSDQIILDPEGEYVAGVEELGGQVVKISESSTDFVNPMDISPYYASSDPDQQTRPVPAKVSFVQSLVEKMTHGLSTEEKNALDLACERTYEKWLETRDERDIPTLGNLVEELENLEGSMAEPGAHLCNMLYRYTRGTSDFFNHQTNVNLTSNLVDFSLVDLRNDLKPLAMMILLDQIWVRVTRNRAEGRRTYLWIDEMQILIDDPLTLHTLDMLWTRGRKWDLYNTGITQNISRVLELAETSYMLQNSPLIVIMRQSVDSAYDAAETFGLSDDQRDVLSSARPGEGVAVIGNQAVHFEFNIDRAFMPTIYQYITTSPDDMRYKRRVAKREALEAELAKAATEDPLEGFEPKFGIMGARDGVEERAKDKKLEVSVADLDEPDLEDETNDSVAPQEEEADRIQSQDGEGESNEVDSSVQFDFSVL